MGGRPRFATRGLYQLLPGARRESAMLEPAAYRAPSHRRTCLTGQNPGRGNRGHPCQTRSPLNSEGSAVPASTRRGRTACPLRFLLQRTMSAAGTLYKMQVTAQSQKRIGCRGVHTCVACRRVCAVTTSSAQAVAASVGSRSQRGCGLAPAVHPFCADVVPARSVCRFRGRARQVARALQWCRAFGS